MSIPLCHAAEHRSDGRKWRGGCLSTPTGERVPALPTVVATRRQARRARGMSAFFWFRFLDGFIKSPISALRFILRHCGVP